MSAQHTPGPWTIARSSIPGYYVCPAIQANEPESGEMFELCALFGEAVAAVPTPVTEANARLIAAAPEMLAALHDAKRQIIALCSSDDVPDSVNAAIAKATGAM